MVRSKAIYSLFETETESQLVDLPIDNIGEVYTTNFATYLKSLVFSGLGYEATRGFLSNLKLDSESSIYM
jgi:hypothetical protein